MKTALKYKTMIFISDSAQSHFRKLLALQGADHVGILVSVVDHGTPNAACRLGFCEEAELGGDEHVIQYEGFNAFVAPDHAAYLEGAQIDYRPSRMGGELVIDAPKLKAIDDEAADSIIARIQQVIMREINPALAAHGGQCALVSLEADGTALLKFGGGCQGCSMVATTLKEGVEKTLRERIPEIARVVDATDHRSGTNPYLR